MGHQKGAANGEATAGAVVALQPFATPCLCEPPEGATGLIIADSESGFGILAASSRQLEQNAGAKEDGINAPSPGDDAA